VTARLTAATLALEAFLVFFATLVASRSSDLAGGVVWGAGLGLAGACVLAAGVVRRPGGLVVGSVLQVLILLTGFWVPVMWLLGALFVAMWCWMVWIGRRIDRDRAAWTSDTPDTPDPADTPNTADAA